MKNKILNIILATFLLITPLVLTGCKTTQPKQAQIEHQVQTLAQTAGAIILIENPNLRPGFSNAVDTLRLLELSTNNITITEVLAVIQRLNIKELRNEKAVLYINAGLLLLTSYSDVPTSVPLETSQNIRGIARSLRIGIQTALDAIPAKDD